MPIVDPFADLPDAVQAAPGGGDPFASLPDAPKSEPIGARIVDAAVIRPTTSYIEGAKDIQQSGLKAARAGLGQIVRGLLSGPRMVESTGGLPDVYGNNQPLADTASGAATAAGGLVGYVASPATALIRPFTSAQEQYTGIPKESWESAALAALPLPKSVAVPKFLAPETAAAEAIPALSSAERAAAGRLQRSIARDQMTPEHLINELATARAERPGSAALGDVGGENIAGMTERLATTPGPGVQTVIPRLNARQEQQAARLSMDLAQYTGSRRSAIDAVKETMDARKAAADPLYQDAMKFDATQSPELVSSFQKETSTGWGKTVFDSKEFKNNLQTEYGVSDASKAPLMVQIDAWGKAAYDIASEAARKGSNNVARVVRDMRNRVLDQADKANPVYGEARSAWAGPTQYMESIESGKGIFSKSAGEVKSEISALKDADREAYITGAVSELMRKLGSNPAKYADLTRVLRSPEMRQKISALMPDAQTAQAWESRLDLEVRMSERAAKATGNSRTAYREAMKEDDESLPVEALLSIASGSKSGLLAKLVDRIPAKVMDALRARSDKVLADVLTNPNSESADRILSVLASKSRPSGSEFRIQARYPSPFASSAAPQSQPNE